MAQSAVAHSFDQIWCDLHGVYVAGWAHAHGVPIITLRLASGEFAIETGDFFERPDVAAHFGCPGIDRSGFKLYLACDPFTPVFLTVVTHEGSTQLPVKQNAPIVFEACKIKPQPMEYFVGEMKQRGGLVIEVGARVVGSESSLQASLFEPECQHVGIDVHAAAGVDIVVDAHRLSTAFDAGSASGVFSLAVMEHIAMPWVLAAEINAVLAEGGLVYHLLPQTFPVHEMPNDFWRMTDEALKILYSDAMGFEVVEAAMMDPVRIY